MRSLIIIVCILISNWFYSQNNDTIKWSASRKLTIDDFKAVPDSNSKFRAVSMIGNYGRYKIKGDTLYVVYVNYFLSEKSWFKKDKKNSKNNTTLLVHEQGHFNIAEIEVRRLRKKISEIKGIDRKKVQSIYNSFVAEFKISDQKIHYSYDKETDFSRNEIKQKEWNNKIAKELKDLETYSEETIKISLKRNS